MQAINWNSIFAKRTQQTRRSAVRELLKVTARPEIISFAGGLPAADLFPVGRVRRAVDSVLAREGARSLQYSETEGIEDLRRWIAESVNREFLKALATDSDSRPIGVENVLITSGSQQALDLIGRVFLEEGDRVIVENPTYLALLSAWRPLGAQFLPVPSDGDGMRVGELEGLMRYQPKLGYLIPNFQNPQGTTLSLVRRKKLVQMLQQHSLAIVEDNPYGDLRYQGSALPHLMQLDCCNASGIGAHVIYTGSFSKVLMPGLRVGYVIAAPEVIEKLVQAKQAADLHTSTLNQFIVLELVRQEFLNEFLPVLKQHYSQRRDAMLAALGKYFPENVTWTAPEGGMFLMVNLPAGWDAAELLPGALQAGVAFVPGEEFHIDGRGRNTLRLNFSNARPARIEEGIGRLSKTFKGLDSRLAVCC